MQVFQQERASPKSSTQLLPEVVTGLSGPLGNAGYVLQTQSASLITFGRSFRPWFIWVGVVFFFPIGLLFLLYKEEATITVAFEPRSDGTLVRVTRKGEKGVARAFEQMQLD
jgi:hypothetical protein